MPDKKKTCSFIGCKAKSRFTWYACADGKPERGICAFHDAYMNMMYMSRTRPRNWKKKMKDYIDKL